MIIDKNLKAIQYNGNNSEKILDFIKYYFQGYDEYTLEIKDDKKLSIRVPLNESSSIYVDLKCGDYVILHVIDRTIKIFEEEVFKKRYKIIEDF